MNLNGKKAIALLAATTLLFGMASCGKNNQNEKSTDATSIGVKSDTDKKYEVKKGDTLYELAQKYYDDGAYWKELAMYNGIKDPKKLRIGQTIYIPRTVKALFEACYGVDIKDKDVEVYVVKKGDTLSEICYKYYDGDDSKETYWKLATYNDLRDPSLIITGQKLLIPPKRILDKVKSYNYANIDEQLMIRQIVL